MITVPQPPMSVLEAIAREEGFYIPGSRPNRNNSPGDLIWGSEAQSFGATHADGRYAVFPDVPTGTRALERWLSIPAHFSVVDPGDGRPKGPNGYLIAGYRGATVAQVLWRFAPPSDGNNQSAYLVNICSWVPCHPDDDFYTLLEKS